MPTLELFYAQYIPEDKIWVPGFTGDINRPSMAFHGDNRDWYELDGGMSQNHRAFTNAFLTFGPTHTILVSGYIGETIQYKVAAAAPKIGDGVSPNGTREYMRLY